MLDYDPTFRLQLAGERAQELARDYRRTQRPAASNSEPPVTAGGRTCFTSLLRRLRRRSVESAPALRT